MTDPDHVPPSAAEPDLADRLNAMASDVERHSWSWCRGGEIALVREAAIEINRLTDRCNHLQFAWAMMLADMIQAARVTECRNTLVMAKAHVAADLATWDRLWREEREANDA